MLRIAFKLRLKFFYKYADKSISYQKERKVQIEFERKQAEREINTNYISHVTKSNIIDDWYIYF